MSSSRTLYLLRHAKSSWDDPGLEDRERPLAPRGRRAAAVLADHVRVNHIEPELVLCSAARRTRETLEGVAPPGEWVIEPELYAASPGDLLERLRSVPSELRSVMVVGHNPAMQVLTLRLAGSAARVDDGSLLADVQRKFPTGALATLTVSCAWGELGPGSAQLTAFARPKQLERR